MTPPSERPALGATAGGERPAGDSAEQRAAEVLIVERISAELAVRLAPRVFTLADRRRVTVDGASEDPAILVEAWAHQGKPKPAQKAKVVSDALKLIWIDQARYRGDARKILALADAAAAAHFTGRTWIAAALRDLRVEVCVVELPEDVRAALRAAQLRQRR